MTTARFGESGKSGCAEEFGIPADMKNVEFGQVDRVPEYKKLEMGNNMHVAWLSTDLGD